jgi:hypothetical protein
VLDCPRGTLIRLAGELAFIEALRALASDPAARDYGMIAPSCPLAARC